MLICLFFILFSHAGIGEAQDSAAVVAAARAFAESGGAPSPTEKAAGHWLSRLGKKGKKEKRGSTDGAPIVVFDMEGEDGMTARITLNVEFGSDIDRDNWVAKFRDAKSSNVKDAAKRKRRAAKRRRSLGGEKEQNDEGDGVEGKREFGIRMERMRQTRALISKLKALSQMSHRAVAARLVANEYELTVATKLHDRWRSQRRVLADGSYEPRIKLLDGVVRRRFGVGVPLCSERVVVPNDSRPLPATPPSSASSSSSALE